MYPESNLNYSLDQAVAQKMKLEQLYATSPAQPHPGDMCAGGQALASSHLGEYSLRDEAQNRSNHHSQEASKAAGAANFFHLHPEFEEFIRLIRNGSIQF